MQYEEVLLDCSLRLGPAPPGWDGDGGALEVKEPGYLRIRMGDEVMYPYREDNGYKVGGGCMR